MLAKQYDIYTFIHIYIHKHLLSSWVESSQGVWRQPRCLSTAKKGWRKMQHGIFMVENDGQMLGKCWENDGKMLGKYWEMMGTWCEHVGKMMGQCWENDVKMMGTWWENDGKMMVNIQYRKMMNKMDGLKFCKHKLMTCSWGKVDAFKIFRFCKKNAWQHDMFIGKIQLFKSLNAKHDMLMWRNDV